MDKQKIRGKLDSDMIEVIKDDENEQPIPSIWRPMFSKIVNSFVNKDYLLSEKIPGVTPVNEDIAKQIEEYIADYGEELTELPDETWESSVCMYMDTHWDVLIDLWAKNEGRSDLVLSAKVTEDNSDYLVNVNIVYVP